MVHKNSFPLDINADRAKRLKRIAKRKEDPNFRERLNIIRRKIGAGSSLFEIRDTLNPIDDTYWSDLIFSIGLAYTSPESMWIEWSVRQETRYKMGAELYSKAKEINDFDGMAKALITLCKIDEAALELQKALGLIKPITEDNNKLQIGVSSQDLDLAEERFNELLEQKIFNKLEAQRQAQQPVTIDVLARYDTREQTDKLESTPLAQSPIE